MIDVLTQAGLLAGLRRVALVALAEIPLLVILMVISVGLAVQPFLPGGLARVQDLIDTVTTSVSNVLAGSADQGREPKGRRAPANSRAKAKYTVAGPRRGRRA